MSKIKDLKRKLEELQKDNANIGAYSEYGHVINDLIDLVSKDYRDNKFAEETGKDYGLKEGILTIKAKDKGKSLLSMCGLRIEKGDKSVQMPLIYGKLETFLPAGDYKITFSYKNASLEKEIRMNGDMEIEFEVNATHVLRNQK
jgi:hypothetical protein